MGTLRNFFTVIVAVLLFFSVLSLNLFWILSSSLTYENIYETSSLVIKGILSNLNISFIMEDYSPKIIAYCQNNSEFVFSEQGYVFEIPCESALQGTDAILNEGIKNVVYQIYYKNYSFSKNSIDELQNNPLFLISEKTHNFTNKILYFSSSIFIILFVTLFFLVDKKSNAFLIPGIYLIFSSLLFFKMDKLISKSFSEIVSQFLGIFFSTSFSVSIKLLILGIVFIFIFILLQSFKIGFWISKVMGKPNSKKEKQTKTENRNKKRNNL